MDTPPLAPQKKGLSPMAWLGIGCGGVVVIAIIGIVLTSVFFGPKIKEFAADMQENPTRATAMLMVKASGGQLELVAEDNDNKRYTVKEKKSGKLITIYWDTRKASPGTVEGDFSAIPAESSSSEPAPTTPEPATPEPAQN